VGGFYYNTNGFAFHRLDDAARVLAGIGYEGIALTPDVHHLDPLRSRAEEIEAFASLLATLRLRVVVETGARFVLDARRKHRPTLLDEAGGARRRLDFLCACVDLAAAIGAPVVTVWSGRAPAGVADDALMARLASGLRALCEHAAAQGVRVGFEPEPGMWIERAVQWPDVREAVGHPALGLTLDVGHCLATGEGDPADAIRAHAPDLLVLQLDDHRRGVHDHLAFGEGEVDFRAIARAVRETGFAGPLEVELSRHSASAPDVAREALAFLRAAFGGGAP
jgi:sugar phosphate isomerase/epimerase